MSSGAQRTLDSFVAQQRRVQRQDERRHDGWKPSQASTSLDDTKKRCTNCRSLTTSDFRRVFAGGDGKAHACTACASGAQLRDGAAADPTYNLDAPVCERRTLPSANEARMGGGY